ncbi:MAG: hypothetical protein ABI596_09300 [Pyrinomonadaceae bacterium]
MTKRFLILFLSIAALGLVANQYAQEKPPSKEQPAREQPANEILADQLAFAGHGMLFDKKVKQIKLDPAQILAMQNSIKQLALREKQPKEIMSQDKIVLKAEELLKTAKLTDTERILVGSEVLEKLLAAAPREIQARYGWRNKAMVSHHLQGRYEVLTTLAPGVLAILRTSGFFTPEPATTDYIRECRDQDVPIPPDWAESGTPWVRQGTLGTNLLQPGLVANVWTYSDPAKRGACIALPRGGGGGGSAAGIICQSATTGHACFWDNKLRSVEPEQFLGWRDRTLVIADLKDGSNLDQPCTQCHHGNNVYLMAPDDATWGKVLRGPLSGTRTGTFTTRLEASSDNQGGRARYIPITLPGGRPGWENNYSPVAGFCASCHEFPALSPIGVPGSGTLRMPPECATGPPDDRAAPCYGTP